MDSHYDMLALAHKIVGVSDIVSGQTWTCVALHYTGNRTSIITSSAGHGSNYDGVMYFLRHKHLILIFISSIVILLFYYVSLDSDSVNENVIDITGVEHEHVGSVGKRRSKLKRILYWNDFYGSKNFGFCCGRGPYLKHNCPNSQCYTSKDRREDLKSFDAIVFHSRSLNSKDIPKIR